MELHIFQSANGDCVLLESADGRRILCDGGMSTSLDAFVAPELGRLRDEGKELDVVYVSHIDQDHIGGVLRMLRNELDWRVFDHQRSQGNRHVREPRSPRPPKVRGLWHNAFRDQITKNRGAIEDLLVAAGPAFLATQQAEMVEAGDRFLEIATSIPEALEVTKLASAKLLGIPINQRPGETGPPHLLLAGGASISLGSLEITVVGPTEKELKSLRSGWNEWLRNNRDRVRALNERLKKRLDSFATGDNEFEGAELRDWNGVPDLEGVTAPNVASLVLLVEEDGKRVLLTGDSQQDVLRECLEDAGLLPDGHLHLDVLKVQHHGSENNWDHDFGRAVSADHYVFCGNGAHGNPELQVLQQVFDSRLGPANLRAKSPRADGRPFKWWFSTDASIQTGDERSHMQSVARKVRELADRSNGLLSFEFNRRDFATLAL
jgi:beta-lactamase superfamily II metal-dependent hydrolase